MAVEFSEYRAPRAVGLFSEPLPEHDGLCWPVCGVDGVGMPHGTGATPKRAFLAWGEHGEAPADAVWVKVTDLGGLQDGGEDAFLWACLYDGRLFLHLGATAPVATAGVVPESGSGFVCKVDGVGMLEGDGAGRHGGPDVYVCGMDERDAYLKTPDGSRWRADASWDVLLLTRYSRERVIPDYGWTYTHMTVWVIVCGNVICFYTTACDPYAWGVNWAAYGSIMCQYGGDPREEDEPSGGQGLGNVQPYVFHALTHVLPMLVLTPLPWHGGGLAVFEGDAASAEQGLGSMNCTIVEDTGFPFGNASFQPDPGIFFCPRLHIMTSRSGHAIGAPEDFPPLKVAGLELVLYGGEGAFSAIGGHYHIPGDNPGTGQMVVPGFNLLFDPWAVEGLGLHKRNTLDFARVDARDYLPPFPGAEWVRVAAATLEGPGGPVYLEIAGAEAGGCLLTASGSTENME